ncbi:MAG: DUF4870 domain-containing protein [Phycisphaerales bacterium]|jgi:hypothetical protein|nr:DUF4870 domain-containing protein [Phycisphaerales bacterium]
MAKISVPDEQQQVPVNEEGNATVASLAHWAFLIGFVVPFASLIIPLVLYNTTGKEDEFVKENAKEALNLFLFSIILFFLFAILCLVLIGIPLLVLLGLYMIIFPIIAAIQTMSAKVGDNPYKYPLIFRLIT